LPKQTRFCFGLEIAGQIRARSRELGVVSSFSTVLVVSFFPAAFEKSSAGSTMCVM